MKPNPVQSTHSFFPISPTPPPFSLPSSSRLSFSPPCLHLSPLCLFFCFFFFFFCFPSPTFFLRGGGGEGGGGVYERDGGGQMLCIGGKNPEREGGRLAEGRGERDKMIKCTSDDVGWIRISQPASQPASQPIPHIHSFIKTRSDPIRSDPIQDIDHMDICTENPPLPPHT